jgi:hypothetical protein
MNIKYKFLHVMKQCLKSCKTGEFMSYVQKLKYRTEGSYVTILQKKCAYINQQTKIVEKKKLHNKKTKERKIAQRKTNSQQKIAQMVYYCKTYYKIYRKKILRNYV